MFAIFEPTMFPITIPLACWREATIEEASSGIDVPTATRVNPMTNSETPSFSAIAEADLTK
ncbi:hypothetical protein SDC9_150536 [bioreactor metagenome]|uniref:Uncharacterized protein n=1 Tax=bioreactor metagenome TaxID=1076179 RepID=A0A645EQ77_9ZZZZ